jgi:hypothetical protein
VRVKIDGQNLAPGTYTARVTNLRTSGVATTEPGKEAVATASVRDVDLDFDSTAQADDNDSFIAANFAVAGDDVNAEVLDAQGATIASRTASCVGH